MPANYAHYRFGIQALEQLSPDLKRPIQRFRRMYDVGLHGPDLFFYYNPLMQNSLAALARRTHALSGREFFTQACEILKKNPSEAGQAYLYGLLCHYCLDSALHPLVLAESAAGDFGHVELEVEFDRFLLEKDGKTPPCTQNFSRHMKLTRGECVTAALFFPSASPAAIHHCVKTMAFGTRVLAGKDRRLLKAVLSLTPAAVAQNLMLPHANHKCFHLDEALLERYEQAFRRFPAMVDQLAAHLDYHAPLGEEFDPSFDGSPKP